MPDILHAVETVDDSSYSMISVCIPINNSGVIPLDGDNYSKKLKKIIQDTLEDTILIEDMARNIGVSPYHMILANR